MTRRQVGVIIAVIMLFYSLVLAGCGRKETYMKGIERIESIIGVSLPEGVEVEYHHYDMSPDSSFAQYTVLKLQAHPDDFLGNYPLEQVTESWGYDDFIRSVKGQKIKQNHIPSFDERMMSNQTKFSSGQEFTVVYFPSTLQLVFYIIHVG